MVATKHIGMSILLALSMTAMPVAAHAAQTADEALHRDLYTAITLEGYHCGAVVGYQRRKDSDYLVTCRTGQRYRVYITPEEHTAVEPHAAPPVSPPGDGAEDTHDDIVKRQLFTIISLAGHDCDRVVRFRREGAASHSATCENGNRFLVRVTAEGRVRVKRHQGTTP